MSIQRSLLLFIVVDGHVSFCPTFVQVFKAIKIELVRRGEAVVEEQGVPFCWLLSRWRFHLGQNIDLSRTA